MTAHRTFITTVVITVIVMATLSAAINVVVDPYGVHRLVSIDGFNAIKPAAQTNLRLAKTYDLKRVRPEVVFLGNSRIDQGFDPHAASLRFDRVFYNAGLPGASIYEVFRILQHAEASGDLKRVLLGLDVFSFNTNFDRVASSFTEGRLAVDADDMPTRPWNVERFRDLHNIYVAWPTLMKSITTIADQDEGWASTRTILGYNPMIEGDYFIQKTGYQRTFEKKDVNYLRRLRRRGLNLAPTNSWPDGAMVYFTEIVAFCREKDIQLDLLIHPYHAHVLEIMHETGIWPAFEAWKRELVAVLASDKARNPRGSEYPLWDFSTYNPITTERVPADGSKQEMTWYWESSHYKEETASVMAIRMYNLPRQDLVPAGFGTKLTVDNLEAHLDSYSEQRRHYHESHRSEIEALERLYHR